LKKGSPIYFLQFRAKKGCKVIDFELTWDLAGRKTLKTRGNNPFGHILSAVKRHFSIFETFIVIFRPIFVIFFVEMIKIDEKKPGKIRTSDQGLESSRSFKEFRKKLEPLRLESLTRPATSVSPSVP
jgi:hypothetical protein